MNFHFERGDIMEGIDEIIKDLDASNEEDIQKIA